MGVHLRTSIKVGPLRFNLSNAGIGVSGGVRGFRVGTGPRGNYISAGRHGRRYQAVLTANNKAERGRPQPHRPPPFFPLGEALAEIGGGTVEKMVSSSSSELLDEIRSKALLSRRWPLLLVVGVIIWFMAVTVMPWWLSLLLLCSFIGVTHGLKRRDELRKTVVLRYDLDQNAEEAWQSFHNGFDWLASSQRTWHLEARARVLRSWPAWLGERHSSLVARLVGVECAGRCTSVKADDEAGTTWRLCHAQNYQHLRNPVLVRNDRERAVCSSANDSATCRHSDLEYHPADARLVLGRCSTANHRSHCWAEANTLTMYTS
jgi:hypothetical protein